MKIQISTLTYSLLAWLISINDENLPERINRLIENAGLEKTVLKVSARKAKCWQTAKIIYKTESWYRMKNCMQKNKNG